MKFHFFKVEALSDTEIYMQRSTINIVIITDGYNTYITFFAAIEGDETLPQAEMYILFCLDAKEKIQEEEVSI